MTNKEILTKARGLIEKGWTKNTFARNPNGNPVFAKDPSACKWCASGAIWAVTGPEDNHRRRELWELLDSLVDSDLAPTYNDAPTTTQADILTLYDKAIARCENDD